MRGAINGDFRTVLRDGAAISKFTADFDYRFDKEEKKHTHTHMRARIADLSPGWSISNVPMIRTRCGRTAVDTSPSRVKPAHDRLHVPSRIA